jgi:hypothetical protein
MFLRELTPDLRRMATDDPSPRVRREAKHVLGDALVVNIHDDEQLQREERRQALDARAARKQVAATSKQLRRSRTRPR